ncbi:MAG: site-specific integrase [Chloroflexi bacterium]|nr:site-specific integrase [Chloroflexota bacterium]
MSNQRQLPLFQQRPSSSEEITRATPFNATWELFAEHLSVEGKSDHTVVAFTSDLDLFGQFHGKGVAIGDIKTEDLDGFMHWLEYGRDVPCSRKSYARRVTTLKVYFKWLHDLGALKSDPAKAILQRSGPAPLSDVLTPAQTEACLHASRTFTFRRGYIPDTRPEMLLRLLLETGIKKNEAMALTPANLITDDPQALMIEVRFKVRNVFKERKIPVARDWLPLYEVYMSQYAPSQVIFDCTARNLEYVLAHIGEKVALPFKLSFEICRWTSALNDLRSGMGEDTIRQKLGLSDISWYETGQKLRELRKRLEEGR